MLKTMLPFAFALALAIITPASAQSVSAGDIIVHYNALPTSSLSPEVARQYGITRSTSRALLNVAVRQGVPGKDKAVPSLVTATARNLSGQLETLALREIREGEAVYYLAEARISGNDTLAFEIKVMPKNRDKPIHVSFRQEFFVQ